MISNVCLYISNTHINNFFDRWLTEYIDMEPTDAKSQLYIPYSLYFQVYYFQNHLTNPCEAPVHMLVSLSITEGTQSDSVPESLQANSQLRGK